MPCAAASGLDSAQQFSKTVVFGRGLSNLEITDFAVLTNPS